MFTLVLSEEASMSNVYHRIVYILVILYSVCIGSQQNHVTLQMD